MGPSISALDRGGWKASDGRGHSRKDGKERNVSGARGSEEILVHTNAKFLGSAAAIQNYSHQSVPLASYIVLTTRESSEVGMPVSGSITSLTPSGGFLRSAFTSRATLASTRGGRFSDDRTAEEEDMVVGVGVKAKEKNGKAKCKMKKSTARGRADFLEIVAF